MEGMELKLTAIFQEVAPEEGGGFMAYVEELPGAITEGDTLEEARENLRDAVRELLEANRELSKRSQNGEKILREELHLLS